ncbi:helix-turn-helix domain-containing protein [Gellertiella hungarica]|uniref:Transcriptional regulator with XRE-family HTH domain n=1 Tax=Gellertiella hungarica TaxID=1572859 RepID=A0A7W6J4Z2_9HYPH|nr:helix-turn-helix transcriptional regulator [Gellertiella hungarica]MBB4064891.1 transcriptional regulator with XRE-family HTH domain [Gellertiella hungarica]
MPYFEPRTPAAGTDFDDTLGGRLSHARDCAGLTLEAVARGVDMHSATIRYWEADRAAPSLASIRKLAAILGVSQLWLLTGEGEGPGHGCPDTPILPLVSRDFSRKLHRRPRRTGA